MPSVLDATVAMPVVNTSNNSERVIFSRYGRTTSADSIPTKMFAALESDSAPLIFIVRWNSRAKSRTKTCNTRR